ncbi:hypothetical protein GF345_01455 [Candidatus Woesearchaeota archaeon]|nr:hypothetical protein [Candidatus Woesearchaeota archaeon]
MGEKRVNLPSFMHDRRFIIACIIIFSILIRILYKNAGLWHFDSYADVKTVEDILTTGTMQYSYAYGAPGMVVTVFLFYYLHHLFTGVMTAEPAYFFVTFITAALGCALLYLIAERLTKNRFISVASALFFSVTPIFLSATTYPKTHALSIFYALLGGYLMMLASEKESWKLLAISGLFFGLNIAIRPDGVLYIIPFLLIYINPRIKNRKLMINRSRFSLINIAAFIVPMAGIWFLLFFPRIIEWGGLSAFFERLNPTTETRGGWMGVISDNTLPALKAMTFSVTWIGWAAIAGGLYYFQKKKRYFELGIMILWFSMFFFLFGNLAVMHARFLLPALIPLMILMAAGCSLVYKRNDLIGYLLVIVIIGSMIYAIHPVLSYRHEHSGTKDFAMFVAQNTPGNAVIMTNDIGFFIRYYGNRDIVFHPRTGDIKEINEFIIELMDYIKQGRPVYATGEGFGIDPGKLVQNAIVANFEIIPVGEQTTEWYGDSTLKLMLYKEQLFRLKPKTQEQMQENMTEVPDEKQST